VSALSSLLTEKLCECEEFNVVEKEGLELVLKLFCQALAYSLEVFDEQIFLEKDPHFRSKGFEKRQLLTVAGPITYRRRRYQTKDGSAFLSDLYLNLSERIKISPLLCSELSRLALDQSYRSAAEALRLYVGDSVNKMTVKRALKTSAELLDDAACPNTPRRVPVLDIEADGTYVALQRRRSQKLAEPTYRHRAWCEVSTMVAYEGKEKDKYGNMKRINTLYHASSKPADEVWKQFCARIEDRWDTSVLFYTNLATDGAPKYEDGKKHLPAQTSSGYDLHHITSALAPTFGADIAREVYLTMRGAGFEAGLASLCNYAEFFFAQKGDEKYLKAYRFIAKRSEAIKNSLRYNLGTIESTNAHLIASRLNRFGGGWYSGLDPMVKLRAARASGQDIPIGCKRQSENLVKQVQTRTREEIDTTIAVLEHKAAKLGRQRKKTSAYQPFYRQVQIAHTKSIEANHSFLHLWNKSEI
jgi:hypothetical protein